VKNKDYVELFDDALDQITSAVDSLTSIPDYAYEKSDLDLLKEMISELRAVWEGLRE
jgi:Mor family transcriptional regulator